MLQRHVFNCSQCSLSILNSPYSKLTLPSFTSHLIPSPIHFWTFFIALPFIQQIKLETPVCSWFLLLLLIHFQLRTNFYPFNLSIAHIFLLLFIPTSTSLLTSLSTQHSPHSERLLSGYPTCNFFLSKQPLHCLYYLFTIHLYNKIQWPPFIDFG